MTRAAVGRDMTFREILFGSDDYRLECGLRDDVLRRPLGLSLNDADLANDEDQWHFGLFEPDGSLAACVVAVRLSPSEAKIRQMAVSPDHQSRGLGTRVMRDLETELRARGFTRFVLNARESAVGFYEKLGYGVAGDAFVDHTIRHFRMTKREEGR